MDPNLQMFLARGLDTLLIELPIYFSSHCRASIRSSRYAACLAREEPPVAGIVRRPQTDNGEYPGHRYTLLHGLQGEPGTKCLLGKK